MPRSSSSSRSLSSSTSLSNSSRPSSSYIPPPKPTVSTPTSVYTSGSKPTNHEENKSQPAQAPVQSGSFLGSMVSGFGFGAGSSIAHRVFGCSNSSSSSTSTQPQTVQPIQPIPIVNDSKINCRMDCDKLVKEYLQCIESASPDHCSHVFDGYKKECV